MTSTFDPRSLEPNAWKRWHKDAFRLLGRVGVAWFALWCSVVVAALYLVADATRGSLAYLGAMLVLQGIGVLLQPVLQHALDQAASAQRVSLGLAFKQAYGDINAFPKWFRKRLVGQLGAFAIMLATLIGIVLALSAIRTETPSTSSIADPLAGVVTLLVFLINVPNLLRKHGAMDFRYWLTGRHGFSDTLAEHLQNVAFARNLRSASLSAMSMIGLYLLVGLSPWNVVSLVALPLMQWYHAAYLRCAYHDIFEGGTGLTEKAKATVDSRVGNATPVLQA